MPDTEQVSVRATQALHSKVAPEFWRLSLVKVPTDGWPEPRVLYVEATFENYQIDDLLVKIQVCVSELERRPQEPI